MSSYIEKVYYEDDNFIIRLEEIEGVLMVHVTFNLFSKDIYQKVLSVWDEIQSRAYWQGYENIYTYTQEPRMLHLFKDGEQIGTCNYKGKEFMVLKWELK